MQWRVIFLNVVVDARRPGAAFQYLALTTNINWKPSLGGHHYLFADKLWQRLLGLML